MTATAMEIDDNVPMADASTAPFTLETLQEPLLSFAKQALVQKDENAAQTTYTYDTLESQLRGHLLERLSSASSLDINKLKDTWTTCWKLCIYLLEQRPDLDRLIRKLPLVLLEDIVECLPSLQQLQDFWESTDLLHTDKLCSGVLWDSPTNNSHVLQYIRLQNALLERLASHASQTRSSEFAGKVLMDMAKALPLSDRSALKLWGSVSGRTTDYSSDDSDNDELATTNHNSTTFQLTKQEQEHARTFYKVFWSVQQDMHNPYSISFVKFFQNCKTILAALESKSLTASPSHTTTTSTAYSTKKYLTKSRLLPLQLQDATFVKHWLTQFLIMDAFCSSQSTQLKTTLADLSNRAKVLFQKLDASQLSKLQFVLQNSETMWRTWKRNKCKPDMEITTTGAVTTTTTSDTTTLTAPPAPPSTVYSQDLTTLTDLQETAKSMALPSLQSFLEPYVDALDPEAGIEEEYHPKHDKLYSWQSLRLLKKAHLLPYFGQIQHSNGNTERMVRLVYQSELNIDIPGEMPELEMHKDYDKDTKAKEEDKVGVESKNDGADKDQVMEDTTTVEEEKEDDGVKEKEGAETTDIKEEQGQAETSNEATAEAANESKVKNEEEKAAKAQDESSKESTKPPAKPLTAFEQAALEEEAILVAEHEEKQAAASHATSAATGTFAAMAAAAPKEEAKPDKKDSKSTTKQKQPETGKRKRESTYGSMAGDTASTKRPRATQQGRNTSDQSTTSQGRRGSGRGSGNWNAGAGGGRGGTAAARGGGRGGASAQPRRSPPPPPQQHELKQRPVPGRGGRGSGRGGRGGGSQRGGRDSRRRSY